MAKNIQVYWLIDVGGFVLKTPPGKHLSPSRLEARSLIVRVVHEVDAGAPLCLLVPQQSSPLSLAHTEDVEDEGSDQHAGRLKDYA